MEYVFVAKSLQSFSSPRRGKCGNERFVRGTAHGMPEGSERTASVANGIKLKSMEGKWDMNIEDLVHAVKEVVADVLELDVEEISADSKLVEDLGADSLDVVDLGFSLAKKLDIKLPQSSVIAKAEEMVGDMSLLVVGDRLTQLGAELLRKSPNAYKADEVFEGQSLSEVFAETKVQHWVNLCAAVLGGTLNGEDLVAETIKKVVLSATDACAVA